MEKEKIQNGLFVDSKNSDEFLDSSKIRTPIFADLHIHSKYSRATSKDISLANLEKWARIKGLGLLGTGDFQHPKWKLELREMEEREGLLYSKTGFPFLWQTEISLIYTQEGKGRRIHYVILAPDGESAAQITQFLESKGRVDYDGRPIFGFSSIILVEEMMRINPKILVIPAHAWTPWFGIFGSKGGFNSLKECFQEQTKNVHAIETGMSSNPEMNWRMEFLDEKAIVSFSDIHSFWPWRLGREATIFKKVEKYEDVYNAIKSNSFLGTIETDPGYGKYHYDGHRNCNFSSSPSETKKINGICPVCNKALTIGVENRIEELANRPLGFKAPRAKEYYQMLPLHEMIGLSLGKKVENKKNWEIYDPLIEKFENEFNILLRVSKEELMKNGVKEKLADLIIKNRESKIKVLPGYDGEYGRAVIEPEQKKLF